VFDIGWQELFIIGLVAVIVIGPKELPRVLRTVTLGIRKLRGMARDFQDGIDELAREADLEDLRKEIEDSAAGTDFHKEIESIADPAREVEASVREIGAPLDAPEKTADKPARKPAEDPAGKPATPAGKTGDGA
jgi:sec-independent protein translocase protein TatB